MRVSLLLAVLLTISCQKIQKNNLAETLSGDLIVFHAGSLSIPFREIAREFNREFPQVRILLEPAGSRICARKISDLERQCDVMASADYIVIDEFLIPKYADWNLKFAGNEMSIVYTDASKKADIINQNNWYRILLDDSVVIGRSNPDTDPCGYRAVFSMQLAEVYYREPGLTQKLLAKKRNFIRPKEVELLALLETNDIDYAFLYRSVAMQHGLNCLFLPDEINLKNPELSDYYRTANVQIIGEKPGSFIIKTGSPMIYGVTIPKNAPNPAAALEFVAFLCDKNKGQAIMEKNGQPSLIPSYTVTFNKLPVVLRKYAIDERFNTVNGTK